MCSPHAGPGRAGRTGASTYRPIIRDNRRQSHAFHPGRAAFFGRVCRGGDTEADELFPVGPRLEVAGAVGAIDELPAFGVVIPAARRDRVRGRGGQRPQVVGRWRGQPVDGVILRHGAEVLHPVTDHQFGHAPLEPGAHVDDRGFHDRLFGDFLVAHQLAQQDCRQHADNGARDGQFQQGGAGLPFKCGHEDAKRSATGGSGCMGKIGAGESLLSQLVCPVLSVGKFCLRAHFFRTTLPRSQIGRNTPSARISTSTPSMRMRMGSIWAERVFSS